jgi:hypothetical protein
MGITPGATNQPSHEPAEALQVAAREFRIALLELLQKEQFGVARATQTRPPKHTREQLVAFEVGFGSPGLKHLEPSLSLESIRVLCSGGELRNVPIIVPSCSSPTPLSTTIAQSFPILVRGTISRTQLVPSPLTLPTVNQLNPKPFEEARANVSALNIRSIALYKPRISAESDYFEVVEGQFKHSINLLQQLFETTEQPGIQARSSSRFDPLSANVLQARSPRH